MVLRNSFRSKEFVQLAKRDEFYNKLNYNIKRKEKVYEKGNTY